jgi:hypothetical protein
MFGYENFSTGQIGLGYIEIHAAFSQRCAILRFYVVYDDRILDALSYP